MSTVDIPRLGHPVQGSTSGKPIMVLFALLSRKWAMGIIWQLSTNQMNFRELQKACDNISPSVLNKRLKELRATGLVDHNGQGYILTKNGIELLEHMKPVGEFAKEWVKSY